MCVRTKGDEKLFVAAVVERVQVRVHDVQVVHDLEHLGCVDHLRNEQQTNKKRTRRKNKLGLGTHSEEKGHPAFLRSFDQRAVNCPPTFYLHPALILFLYCPRPALTKPLSLRAIPSSTVFFRATRSCVTMAHTMAYRTYVLYGMSCGG